ncbi:N-acetyltransferase [[Leptolyngbya] sp. PCC 7376]|uniref:GNAT family N-acetyltransferase n=1 Tax=[Leptolyngbya] sp. PCC 7376 TaxID=111781 RepID=UPI001CED0B34|nr:N-acetyltransferase [[Leptolyngbya] sp. PCC 7376]
MDDAPALATVITQSFHRYSGVRQWFVPLLRLGVCEDFRYRLRSSEIHHVCFVACLSTDGSGGSVIVGTVELAVKYLHSMAIAPMKSPYISNLAVDLQYRRLGIARKLLNRCEVQVRRWNYGSIALHVLDNNEGAKELYRQCGYEIKHSEKNIGSLLFKQPHRLFLQKNLSP